jgi:subtilisin family serine protease
MRTSIRAIMVVTSCLMSFSAFAQNELFVKTKSGGLSPVSRGLLQGSSSDYIKDLNVVKVTFKGMSQDAALRVLKSDPDVVYAEPRISRSYHMTPNDPRLAGPGQYGIRQVRAIQAWDTFTGSSSMVIAVLDSGFLVTHEDLASRVAPGQIDIGTNSSNVTDNVGHGTHVAGSAAAATNNGKGVASVAFSARFLPIKLGDLPTADLSAKAIVYASNNGARIVNMSYGGPSSQVEADAVKLAWSRGLILFSSAGNSNFEGVNFPAGYPEVIAIGATDSNDQKALFSNFGKDVDLAGPGDRIDSTSKNGNSSYELKSGTSMASPNVCSVAALVWSRNPTITNARLRDVLFQTADPVGSWVVRGRVNALKAVELVAPFEPITSGVLSASIGVSGGLSEGSIVAGDTSSVVTTDGNLFSVRSANFNKAGNIASVDTLLKIDTPRSAIKSLSASVTASGPSPATMFVFVYNYRRATWEQAGTSGLSTAEKAATVSISLVNLSDYINSAGHIRIYARAVQPARIRNGEFVFHVNKVSVQGLYDPTLVP